MRWTLIGPVALLLAAPLILAAVCSSCADDQAAPPAAPSGPAIESRATGSVVAKVTGLRNDRGTVIARLYRGRAGFPSDAEAAYREATVPIRAGAATVSFTGVPYAEYAIWICHDEDGNGKLNTNFLGMPREGVGVSGPPPSFIPSYGDARFTLDRAASEHAIHVKYL